MTGTPSTSAAKRAVLDHLKSNGPSEAAAIAEALGVTAMAVRQHLYALEDDGLVSFAATRNEGGRGRPSKLWRVEQRADPLFPDAHADLSVELIANIREIFGDRGLTRLIEKRTEHQIAEYQDALAGASSLREKVKRIVRLRTAAGYMADAKPEGAGFLLIENHCPICRAAAACTGLCRQELEVFRAAFGADVTVERTDHILAGARRCAYSVVPRRV
jgi:predicted ArsR family transcriptional regulator